MKYALPAACVGILAAFSAQAQQESIYANDVVVTASRVPQSREDALGEITVINREQIEKSGQSTLVELLQSQPGIEISSTGGLGTASGVFIRGANKGHALVLIDGIRQGSVTLGETAFQHLQPSQIERIEMLRGPASSLYGSDAIGGVIQIFTKKGESRPRANAAIGYGSYNTRTLEAGYGGQINGTRFNVQASSIDSNSFSAKKKQTQQNKDDDAYRNTSISANLSQSINENHELGLNFLNSRSHGHFDGFPSSFDHSDEHTLRSWSVYSKNRFLPMWQSDLQLGESIDDSTSISGPTPATVRTEQKQVLWQNNIDTGVGTLLLGSEWLKQEISGNTDYAVTDRTTRALMAGYLNTIGKHSIQANMRTDDNSRFGTHNTGGLAYGYQFNQEWRVSGGVSTAFKAPTFNDLYFPDDGCGDMGNPDLQPEKSRNREVALHWEAGGSHASATVYDNKVENLIDWQPNGPNICGFNAFTPVNVGKARLRGLTLAWQGQINDVLVRASADLQKPEDESTGNLLVRRARKHGAIWAGKTFGKLELGTELVVSGERFEDAENTQKLDGYSIMNITANYSINPDWKLEARANNVFDRDYELSQGYNTPGINVFVGLRWQPN